MTEGRSVIEVVVDGEVVSVIEVVADDGEHGSVVRPQVVVREFELDADAGNGAGNGAENGDDKSDLPRLTKREVEVLELIAAGHSTREIAGRLFISPKTVRNHLAAVYRKLDARNRTEAVLSGMRLGLVPPK
jgi:DNA-binding CsgD family transcriptional regulator